MWHVIFDFPNPEEIVTHFDDRTLLGDEEANGEPAFEFTFQWEECCLSLKAVFLSFFDVHNS